MWVTVAVSFTASASCAACTVTVCGVLQSVEENVRSAGSAVTSVLPVGSLMVTVTSAVGCVSSTMVYVPLPPSATVSAVSKTVTPAVSSSVTVTSTLLAAALL